MSGVTFLWLGLATAVFVGANAVLKIYAVKGGLPVLIGALALFCVGNFLMVQVMKANGLGLAIALSAIFQLVAISVMANGLGPVETSALLVDGVQATATRLAAVKLKARNMGRSPLIFRLLNANASLAWQEGCISPHRRLDGVYPDIAKH